MICSIYLTCFIKKNVEGTFLKSINVSDEDKEKLLQAKNEIKGALIKGIKAFTATEKGGGKSTTPKFYTQGSWAYKTINSPCQNPPQQVDYDYGTYLPISYLDNEHPVVAAKLFFEVVDNILRAQSEKHNWSFDNSKDTCSRVIINKKLHIDVPLYSMPDEEFQKLTEKALARGYASVHEAVFAINEQEWMGIDNDKIMLATRNGDWTPSDPLMLHRWFLNEVATYGEQIRRVCRYIKSWRDFYWERGGPSSIFLMVCVSQCFNSNEREDIALLNVLKLLPKVLSGTIKNPTDENEILSDRVDSDDIERLKSLSASFYNDFYEALNGTETSIDACNLIRKHLGERFPQISTLEHEDIRSVIAATAPSTIKSDKIPKRTKAGWF